MLPKLIVNHFTVYWYTYIIILCCTPEMNTMFYINYISVKLGRVKNKRKKNNKNNLEKSKKNMLHKKKYTSLTSYFSKILHSRRQWNNDS